MELDTASTVAKFAIVQTWLELFDKIQSRCQFYWQKSVY